MKDLKIYLSIASVLLVLYVIAQFNRQLPVDWTPTFSKNDKIPYGTYVLYQRLNDILPGTLRVTREPAFINLTETKAGPGSYIIITGQLRLDEYDFKELVKYMQKGNEVFIAAFYAGDFFQDSLKLKINSELKSGDSSKTELSFVNPALNPQKKYAFDRGIGGQYFSSYDTARAVILGKNNRNHCNFLKYNYGKGALYVIAGPLFFTNYNMLKPEGADYAAKALSYLQPKSEIIWDEFSHLGREEDLSLMRVFFNHKELKWAYYIAFFSMLIYVMYEVKRRQQIIPVIDPVKNTSLEFVKIVGQLFYQRHDNTNIMDKKINYLLGDIRTKYNLKTNVLDENFAQILVIKSGVQRDVVDDLLNYIRQFYAAKAINDDTLIKFNRTREIFYQQSK